MRTTPNLPRRTLVAVVSVVVTVAGVVVAAASPVDAGAAARSARPTSTGPPAPALPSGRPARLGTVGESSLSGPDRLAAPHPGRTRAQVGASDGTPLSAAAGTEPGEMGPIGPLPPGWTSSVQRFDVGSMTRSYLMVRAAPARWRSLPVVVILHGRNETPAIIEAITHAPQVTGPAILVFPAGYGRSWDAGGCCGLAHRTDVADVAFLTDAIHRVLAAQRDADPSRVSMVGFSNGGRMAYRMACDVPGLLSGVAAVEAVPVDRCAGVDPIPIMIVASSNDPLLAISDRARRKTIQGYVEPTVQTTVEDWRHLDGCSPAGRQAEAGAATVATWSHCRSGGRVAYALYAGGGHRWPGAAPPTGSRGATPSAGALIWSWLHRDVVLAEPAPPAT